MLPKAAQRPLCVVGNCSFPVSHSICKTGINRRTAAVWRLDMEARPYPVLSPDGAMKIWMVAGPQLHVMDDGKWSDPWLRAAYCAQRSMRRVVVIKTFRNLLSGLKAYSHFLYPAPNTPDLSLLRPQIILNHHEDLRYCLHHCFGLYCLCSA
jgi:hypothetical protein